MEATSGSRKTSQHTATLVQVKGGTGPSWGGGSKDAKNRYGSRGIGAKGKGMIGKDEGMWRIKEYP